jgi:hypothetical protein
LDGKGVYFFHQVRKRPIHESVSCQWRFAFKLGTHHQQFEFGTTLANRIGNVVAFEIFGIQLGLNLGSCGQFGLVRYNECRFAIVAIMSGTIRYGVWR